MDRLKLEQIIARGVDFDIQKTIERGFDIFKQNPLMHMGFTLLIMGLQFLFTFYLEDFAFINTIFLSPPLLVGFYLVANRVTQREFVDFPNFFDGFKYWVPVVLINLISSILTVLGILLFVIPGIYLGVSYMFCLLFGIFGGFEFWTSMELSRRLVTRNWVKFFLLVLVFVLINALGILALGVGILISLPVTYLSIYGLFEELTHEAAVFEEE